jgi:DNA-binding MarR family transcriptional regulator
MHAMFFGFKRAHWRVVGITRQLLRGIVLTPARFDMMRIIAMHGEHGVLQAKIRDLLGVSAPTVSVMLRALELLGFVKRSRFVRDARHLLVKITEVGKEQVGYAIDRLIKSGVADELAGNALSRDPEVGAAEVERVRGYLRRIRQNYADPAPFEDPWCVKPIMPRYGPQIPPPWSGYVSEEEVEEMLDH